MTVEFIAGELYPLLSTSLLNIFAFSKPINYLFAPFTTYLIVAEIPSVNGLFNTHIQFLQPNIDYLTNWDFDFTIVTLRDHKYLLMRCKNDGASAISLSAGEILFELITSPVSSDFCTQTQNE